MRTYYASDKKRREESKRQQKERKRLKRLNKAASAKTSAQETGTEPVPNVNAVPAEGQET